MLGRTDTLEYQQMKITLFALFLLLPSAPGRQAVDQKETVLQIGSIDYFGYEGLNLKSLHSHLPVKVGDSVSSASLVAQRESIRHAVAEYAEANVTDIATMCCDSNQHIQLYIGLNGKSSKRLIRNPVPTGPSKLPDVALQLYREYLSAEGDAVLRGNAAEDHDRGYALSRDPETKNAELKLRLYALRHPKQLEDALAHASSAEERQASACLLGYANRSRSQIDSLISAVNDPNDEVRNDAVRALWALASAKGVSNSDFEANLAPFIDLLFSGSWLDRNKSSLLLEALTRNRNQFTISALRDSALAPLIEGAKWHDAGHSFPFVSILGRIENIPETDLQNIIQSQHKAEIIDKACGLVKLYGNCNYNCSDNW